MSVSTAATLLIVDDEDRVRRALREHLGREGYNIIEACTVAEGIEKVAVGADVGLLDYSLPDGYGLMIVRRMKEVAPDTPVILMMSHATMENAAQATRLGVWHHIGKPFKLDDVSKAVRTALEASRLRRHMHVIRIPAR